MICRGRSQKGSALLNKTKGAHFFVSFFLKNEEIKKEDWPHEPVL